MQKYILGGIFMKRVFFAALVFTLALFRSQAMATPSTTYWTPATSDIQPYGVAHLGIDNYFTLQKKSDDATPALPTDVGLTVGVLPFERIQMEVGVDFMAPTEDQFMFNAKIGTPEGALFEGSPAINLGVFNAGTKTTGPALSRTDQNIVDIIVGKTLPIFGCSCRFHAGGYIGNPDALVNGNGEKENTGYMIGWDMGIMQEKESDGGEYYKWVFAADFASGKNAIGGGGAGVYHYFTKNISVLTGPVWFNEEAINGKWKWTTQLDINW
jgi:hypothetical protein